MTMQPAGDYYCGVCGAPGGHGNLQCPQLQARDPFPQYVPYAFPQPNGTEPVNHGAKLDRIIEQLEFICNELRRD